MYIVTKVLLFILIFAILIVLKEGINFFLVMREALKGEGNRQLNLSTLISQLLLQVLNLTNYKKGNRLWQY